jgi:putative transposase
VSGHTRTQRCWVHKTGNVLNRLPKHLQAKVKSDLQQVWMAPTREHASRAFEIFLAAYNPKYPKAADLI